MKSLSKCAVIAGLLLGTVTVNAQSYINNSFSAAQSANFWIGGVGKFNSGIWTAKDGADTWSSAVRLTNFAEQRGANLQLTGGAEPGLAIWLTDGTTWFERMRITPKGNVGIGTIDPGSYKLAVEGTIGARRLKVTQGTWADFVFEPDYQLPPLQELETYIKTNKHLPDVPSAAEVAKDGLDVGEMNKILLQKIEELTLHLIEQEKEMNKLKERIKIVESK
jgi:hypothetical protein